MSRESRAIKEVKGRGNKWEELKKHKGIKENIKGKKRRGIKRKDNGK